jgi:hypothetical protein
MLVTRELLVHLLKCCHCIEGGVQTQDESGNPIFDHLELLVIFESDRNEVIVAFNLDSGSFI